MGGVEPLTGQRCQGPQKQGYGQNIWPSSLSLLGCVLGGRKGCWTDSYSNPSYHHPPPSSAMSVSWWLRGSACKGCTHFVGGCGGGRCPQPSHRPLPQRQRAPPTTPAGWGPSQAYPRWAQGREAGEGPSHLSSRWTRRCSSQSSQTIPTGPHSPLWAFSHCNESCEGFILLRDSSWTTSLPPKHLGMASAERALPGAPKQSVITGHWAGSDNRDPKHLQPPARRDSSWYQAGQ